MRSLWLLSLALIQAASGGEWSEQPIDPKVRPNHTAYTVGKNHWQIGLVRQNYGILDNAQIGTQAPLWALGVVNGNAKVTAIQTPRLDVSIDGGAYWSSLAPFGVDGDILATPVGWTASWAISDRFSLHGGTAWTLASANGRMGAPEIAQGIEAVTGADITAELTEVLGDQTGLYAGANLTLYQTRLSADVRFSRRDSLILTSNTYVFVSGLVAAGVAVDDIEGVDVEAGASARVRVPLTESIPSLTTLSWQFDWRRVNLRVGVPLPLDNTFAWFQAVDLYLILGPSRRAEAAVEPVDDPGADDTGTDSADDTGAEDTGEAPADDTGADDTGEAPADDTADVADDPGAPAGDTGEVPADDTGDPQAPTDTGRP